jgi:hypothetical protein
VKIDDYNPPFVYFGGKKTVADIVWRGLGDVDNYVEPFFGSGAVLFLRPDGDSKRIETVNDADGFVANFWRAMKHDVEAVVEHAMNPVNECDLHARHLWIVGNRQRITEQLCGDADWFDAKAAGWWVWGINCWIGSGWCSGKGPWVSVDGVMQLRDDGDTGTGVNRQLPHLGNGRGVNRKLPHLGNTGTGVNRQLPHLRNTGTGVNRQLPDSESDRRSWLRGWLGEFGERLARVRVCCGDWSRVCGPSVTLKHGTTGVFLDPPYADTAKRSADLYALDCEQVAHRVREWAIEQGTNPLMRICLAGYEGEHAMPSDWVVHEWEAVGGYGNQGDDENSAGRANSKKERLWFSPHCQSVIEKGGLFTQ